VSRYKSFAALAALLAGGLFAVAPARADLIFDLNQDFCTGGCGPGGGAVFGTVTLHDVSTGVVNVEVKLNDPPSAGFVSTGQAGTFAFDLTGNPNIVVSNLTSGWVTVNTTGNGFSQHMDGAGFFEYTLDCHGTACGNGGTSPTLGPLDFTVTADSITSSSFVVFSCSQSSSVPCPNPTNSFMAADIIGTNGNTGIVAVPTPIIGHGLFVLLAVGGVLFGGKLLESYKRHSSLGTA
jgi:hypothetical protein